MTVLRFMHSIVVVYLVILSLRILGSWFQGISRGRAWQLLEQVTNPYLRIFSRFGFLHRGMFDFTPLAAFFVLIVLLDVISAIMQYGRLTLGIVLATVVKAGWSGLSFLMIFFVILGIARLVVLFRGRPSSFSEAVGRVSLPLTNMVRRYLPAHLSLSEIQCLYIALVVLVAVRFLGGILINMLINALYHLPF